MERDDTIAASPRTLLFVPGVRPDRYDKAVASGADAVIVDLEDSVPATGKDAARASVASWLETGRAWVRVNSATSAEVARDLAALAGRPGLLGVVVPKAEGAETIDTVVDATGGRTRVIALVESARGLLHAPELAEHPHVDLLAFGNLDFAEDCAMSVESAEELELLPARTHLVVASRAAGIPGPIDGVTADVRDAAAAQRDAERAVRLGFSGKLCVHPSQVSAVHQALRPTTEQIAWARRILSSLTDGVGVVEGAMVDRPVLLRAQRILSRAPDQAED